MRYRWTTVYHDGRYLNDGERLLAQVQAIAEARAKAEAVKRVRAARLSAADADKVGAQLRARAYGVSRGSVADKGRVERLAIGRG